MLLAALAGAPLAGAPVAGAVRPSDRRVGDGALLRRSDFPRGWAATPASRTPPKLTCPGFRPDLRGVTQTSAVSSPGFEAGMSGPFVSQAVYVYATASQASLAWARLARPGLLRCLAESVTAGSGGGVRFAVTHREVRDLAVSGARTAGYRVIATASTAGQTITAYVDLLLVGRGRVASSISLAAFGVPVALALERRLEHAVAGRLRAAAAQ